MFYGKKYFLLENISPNNFSALSDCQAKTGEMWKTCNSCITEKCVSHYTSHCTKPTPSNPNSQNPDPESDERWDITEGPNSYQPNPTQSPQVSFFLDSQIFQRYSFELIHIDYDALTHIKYFPGFILVENHFGRRIE
jgi:hypothetical protein